MKKIIQSDVSKFRRFRIDDKIVANHSYDVKFHNLYHRFGFARSRYEGSYVIFEISSGYVVGQGKKFKHAQREAINYLRETEGRFSLIVDHFKLPKFVKIKEDFSEPYISRFNR